MWNKILKTIHRYNFLKKTKQVMNIGKCGTKIDNNVNTILQWQEALIIHVLLRQRIQKICG